MNGELPEGWVATTLGAVCSKPQYGWTCRAAKIGKIKYVRTTDISNGTIDWATVPYCDEAPTDIAKYRISPNDILVSRAGSVGVSIRVGNVPCDAVFASYLIRFKPLDGVSPEFVEYFLKSAAYWQSISEFSSGIAIPNVNASKLASLELPLAPPFEQRRIVTKLTELIGRIDNCREHLARARVLLEQFRQAVLAAACSGRLTADWRQSQGLAIESPALRSTLSNQLPTPTVNVVERSKTGALPDSWEWVALGQLGHFTGGGTPPKNIAALWNGTIPWVSPKDMKRARIADAIDHVSEAAFKVSPIKLIPTGSILFVVRGMILNHTLPIAITDMPIAINQDMKALTPAYSDMAEYIFIASQFIAQKLLFEVKEATHGTRRLETALLLGWAVPLPPLKEQQEIVRRVTALFSFADSIESRLQGIVQVVEHLQPSLFRKAFDGDLIQSRSIHAPTT